MTTRRNFLKGGLAFCSCGMLEAAHAQQPRPHRLPVNALDTLFSDPFSVYERHVLGLKELDAMDAEAQASDFGSLAHKAIHALTLHWNSELRPVTGCLRTSGWWAPGVSRGSVVCVKPRRSSPGTARSVPRSR